VHIPEPTLSVICVFRNRKEWVEPTLKAFYSISRIPSELIIIDDASTDGTTEAIRSIIEYYQHEQTYFFEQEAPRGRGNSLNSALEQVRGRILWLPENLQMVDHEWFSESVEALISSSAHTAIAMDDPVPKSPMDWLHLLQNDRVPHDRNYLFNLGRMRSIRKFIDPHWSTRHATELAIRLMSDSDPIPAKLFAKGETRRMEMDDRSKKECALAMFRIPELSLSGQEKAFRMLRSFGHTDTEEDEGSAEMLYQEAQALYKSGNSVAALELLNRILAAEPDHRRARLFKIQILEKMRRYVEAAELKHGYDREPSPAKPDVKDPKELDAADDDPGMAPGDATPAAPEGITTDAPDETASEEAAGMPADSPEEPEAAQRATEATAETGNEADDFYIDLSDTDTAPEDTREPDDLVKPDERTGPEVVSELDAIDLPALEMEEAEGAKDEEEDITPAVDAPEAERKPAPEEQKPAGDEIPAAAQQPSEEKSPDERVKHISAFGDELSRQPRLTMIIPTSTVRRPVLEDCLTSVFRQTSTDRTRVIVVDNGSVDDTSGFLRNLLREHPNLLLLRNEQNQGFAGAVNQGLAKAGDGYVIVMHNDVMLRNPVPARLAHKLEKNPDIGLIVPRTERNTWNPAQRDNHTDDRPFTDTDVADGYLMAFRNEPGLSMSRDYGLAYFDDADFCYRIQKKGYRIVIDNREHVVHLGGKTTADLGLAPYTKAYWKNSAHFHKEWDIAPRFPSDQTRTDPLRQFVVLGELINPFYPEEHLLEHFNSLFTSEQKTRVLKTEFPPDALKAMLRVLIAANQRDVLRKLEEQLDPLPPDRRLYYDLITFYFDRTIYSRCKKYLEKLGDADLPVTLELYHLKIALGEKDFSRAAELLHAMVDKYPTHPEVLITAAEIHRRGGNREQSDKFTTLARTFDPLVRP
jgi:GT2 family glycosyltransferase/tetratricopeptide (TPR) repeat protein